MSARRLFLDMDGVLADFDKRAAEVFGMPPAEFDALHGQTAFWARLDMVPEFFASFDPMPDAMLLWESTRHLSPTILTSLPRRNGVADEKRRWIAERLGPDVPVITCLGVPKATHCRPGDVLVDDWERHRAPWKAAGGVFVLHTDAASSLKALADLGVLPPADLRRSA